MFVKTIDGTPDAVKVACPVLAGGKAGDYIKGLPIRTSRKIILHSTNRVYILRSSEGRKKLQNAP